MLNFIAPHLTRSDLLDLYGYLNEFRRETEWLAQFESIFAADPAALPKLPSIQNYMANQHGADPLENMEQLQSELCRRFGVSPAFLVPHLMLGVSADVFSRSLPLNGLRHPPEHRRMARAVGSCGLVGSFHRLQTFSSRCTLSTCSSVIPAFCLTWLCRLVGDFCLLTAMRMCAR